MCVVALALNAHPRWRLVLAGNRDEFHARASAPLAHWVDAPGVIAGRDLVSGGSWLGLSGAGRVAVVTNVRNPDGPDPALKSRGELVSNWLVNGASPDERDLAGYNAFSLCLLDSQGARLLTNRPAPSIRTLSPGLHSLSNGEGDQPWPRRSLLESALSDWLREDAEDPCALFEALADETPCGESGDAPIFIRAPVYGTRCSTIIAVDVDGNGLIAERRFAEHGSRSGETLKTIVWP